MAFLNFKNEKSQFKTLILTLFLITLYRGLTLAFSGIQLYFDEAYYFTWAHQPAFGYYSKPPMIAWEIWGLTSVCGESEACIRLGSLVNFFGAAILQYFITRKFFNSEAAFYSALAFATLPFVSLYSWMATTDSLLILFWSASILCLLLAIETQNTKYYILLGLAVGCGLLSKYTMLFFFLCAGIYIYLTKVRFSSKWLITLGVSLMVLAPNLVWNYQHQGVSFTHTAEISQLDRELFHPIKLAEFLGGQLIVFGPVFMAFLVMLLVRWRKLASNDSRYFLLSFGGPVLITYTVLSLLTRANLNWAVVSYVAATSVVVDYLLQGRRYRLLHAAILFNIIVGLFGYHEKSIAKALGVDLHFKQDVFAQMTGWKEVSGKIASIINAHPGSRLIADHRRLLSELIYYIKPHPFDAVIWNPSGEISDQFTLKSDLKSSPNGEFVFVSEYVGFDAVANKFQFAEDIGNVEVPIYPDKKLAYRVYLVRNFLGY